MKKQKKRVKVNLWFSENRARDGQFYFVPISKGEKMVKCTGITVDKIPPCENSVFISSTYLSVE